MFSLCGHVNNKISFTLDVLLYNTMAQHRISYFNSDICIAYLNWLILRLIDISENHEIYQRVVLLMVGRSYVGNGVTHSTLLDRRARVATIFFLNIVPAALASRPPVVQCQEYQDVICAAAAAIDRPVCSCKPKVAREVT